MTIAMGSVSSVLAPTTAPAPTPATGARPSSQQAQLHQMAQQFEGVLLRQLLSTVKVTGSEDGGGYGGMAQDALADGIESGGGLGLTRQLEDALARASQRHSGRPDEP